MKITSEFYPSFKAHTYTVSPKVPVISIKTDNNPNLGNEPCVVSSYFMPHAQSMPMIKDGKEYYLDLFTFSPTINYHIKYKDTGKEDKKQGADYAIDCKSMLKKADTFLAKLHHRPLIHAIKPGKTIGELKCAKINNEREAAELFKSIKKPTILMVNSLFGRIPENPNIVGIICSQNDFAMFSHYSTQLRNGFDIFGCVHNPDITKKLAKFNGKKIELKLNDNDLKFEETNKPSKKREYPQISIPKLRYTKKVLTPKEYTPDKIGAKAVNLKRLEQLKQDGKIDIEIPKSIALPYGFIEEFLSENPNPYKIYNDEYCKQKTEDLKRVLEQNGINSDILMVRSAFNGEDLSNFSAAGLYSTISVSKSQGEYKNNSLYNAIKSVANSKNLRTTREIFDKYNINYLDIKPGIILQNGIIPDYKFTLYTDDNSGNVKIDLISGGSNNFEEGRVLPHVFTYNKGEQKLSYDSIQLGTGSVTFDENMNITGHSPIIDNLSGREKLFEQLKQLSKTAITIEKEFGAPQDIEGGIKDGKIYLWQSRNIVNF